MKRFKAGVVIRGEWIEDHLVEFGGRGTGFSFLSPDPKQYLSRLPLQNGLSMEDMYELRFDDILDYADELGQRLRLSDNAYLQEALEASCLASSLTPPILRATYESLPNLFNRDVARETAENTLGIDVLEGWVERKLFDGRKVSVRAFGARSLHIIAGNSPMIAGLSILRNFLTRGDAIIKSPSNDPFTALAIARTMVDMAPTHPLTKHLSVAYWKGGDESLEQHLYQPHNIEKILAWGGLASVKHVTKYVQPGLELISLDPKRSVSIIGPEAFASEDVLDEVALRLATDIGAMNQEGCINARVIYVLSGTDDDGLARLNRLAEKTYQAMTSLPEAISTPPKEMDPELRSQVKAVRLSDDYFRVIGGEKDEGAIIASQTPEPVDFALILAKRVANLVPIDDIGEIYPIVDAYTQTVGIYPESLKKTIRDRLSLSGAQRFVSLGYATSATLAGPQDAIETIREMCRWIICEDCDPEVTAPPWETGASLFHRRKVANA